MQITQPLRMIPCNVWGSMGLKRVYSSLRWAPKSLIKITMGLKIRCNYKKWPLKRIGAQTVVQNDLLTIEKNEPQNGSLGLKRTHRGTT